MTKILLPRSLSLVALLGALAFASVGCDGGDDGDDEVSDDDVGTDDNMDADTDTTTDTADTADTADLMNGMEVHDSLCAVQGCHDPGAAVQLSERVPMLDDAGLEEQIRNGGNGMPAFNETLISAEDMVDLIAYLRDTYG